MCDELMETVHEKRRVTKRCFGCSIKYIGRTSSACLFELQLNEKQLELVGSEKQLELDSC
jgi:hypothetical protein